MTFRTNDEVVTLLGLGVVQGQYADGRYMVRIQITDENRRNLADKNCDTPKATLSGVWLLEEGDLTPGPFPKGKGSGRKARKQDGSG